MSEENESDFPESMEPIDRRHSMPPLLASDVINRAQQAQLNARAPRARDDLELDEHRLSIDENDSELFRSNENVYKYVRDSVERERHLRDATRQAAPIVLAPRDTDSKASGMATMVTALVNRTKEEKQQTPRARLRSHSLTSPVSLKSSENIEKALDAVELAPSPTKELVSKESGENEAETDTSSDAQTPTLKITHEVEEKGDATQSTEPTEHDGKKPNLHTRHVSFFFTEPQKLDVALQEVHRKGKAGKTAFLGSDGRDRFISALFRAGRINSDDVEAYTHRVYVDEDDNITERMKQALPAPNPDKKIKSLYRGKQLKGKSSSEAVLQRLARQEAVAKRFMEKTGKSGAVLTKYSLTGNMGRPSARLFYITNTAKGYVFTWCRPGNAVSIAFSMKKSLNLEDVWKMYYGPFYSTSFDRYNAREDGMHGKPWLAFTIEFHSRTINLACKDTRELMDWYLGLQAIAPYSSGFKTRGKLLWQLMIMKINWYGLRACSDAGVIPRRGG